jgi:hypothetical protein
MTFLRNEHIGAMRHERISRAVVALIPVAGVKLGASLGSLVPVAKATSYPTYTCALQACPHRLPGARPGSSYLFKLTLKVPRRTYPVGAVIHPKVVGCC